MPTIPQLASRKSTIILPVISIPMIIPLPRDVYLLSFFSTSLRDIFSFIKHLLLFNAQLMLQVFKLLWGTSDAKTPTYLCLPFVNAIPF